MDILDYMGMYIFRGGLSGLSRISDALGAGEGGSGLERRPHEALRAAFQCVFGAKRDFEVLDSVWRGI